MAWTDPTTRATGELITAVEWNTDLVENLKVVRKPPASQLYYTTGSLSVPASPTVLTIPLAGVGYDYDNMTATANTLTIKTAGVYTVSGSATWGQAALSASSWVMGNIGISVNGGQILGLTQIIGGTSLGTPVLPGYAPVSFDLHLAVNDTLNLVARHSYGFAVSLVSNDYGPRLSASLQSAA